MKGVLAVCLLVCSVYFDVGLSLPNLNATNSSPIDNQISGDEKSNQIEQQDMKQKIMNPESRVDMEDDLQFKDRPRKDISILKEWATRGIFSGRRNLRRHGRGMYPRSFRRGRSGYFGRYPGRFRRYAPYGPHGHDQFMDNYASYPQTHGGSPMYDQAPFARPLPSNQQSQFSLQAQSPYAGTQLHPPVQPYYRDPYNTSSQQPQLFAASPSYSPSSRINARPEYYSNRPGLQSENQPQRVGSTQFTTPTRATEPQMMPAPTSHDTRYRPSGSELSRAESFDQFNPSASAPPSGERDGAHSRTRPVQGNRNPLAGSELQRTGSFDQFGTSTKLTDERGGPRSRAEPSQENRDPPAESELPRTESSDQFRTNESGSPRLAVSSDQLKNNATSPAGQRDESQTPVETPADSRPVSGLFSFLRGPSATTKTESNNPQSRSITDFDLQQIRERPALAQAAPQATVAA